MSVLQAILLGLLQGATEFLPVSSSGHLVVVPWLLGWSDPGLTFDTVLHLGTLVAVLIYFWADIVQLFQGWWRSIRTRRLDTVSARLSWLIILSAVPGAILGVLFDDLVEGILAAPAAVSVELLITGILLMISEWLWQRERERTGVGLVDALLMGVAQAVAIIPGISRSGATISTGLVRGLKREDAARFSFLIGIPIIAGAAFYQLAKTAGEMSSTNLLHLVLGFLTAMMTGYVAIRFLLNYVRTHSLRPFAYYCWAIGILGLAVSLLR